MAKQTLRKYWTRWFAKRGLEAYALEVTSGWVVLVGRIDRDPEACGRAPHLDDAIRDAYRRRQEAIEEELREQALDALALEAREVDKLGAGRGQ